MGVKLNIEYKQLLELARQLSPEQKKKFIEDLGQGDSDEKQDSDSENGETTEFQKFLLQFSDFVATEEDLKGYEAAGIRVNEMFKK